jgi:hypothetical protein
VTTCKKCRAEVDAGWVYDNNDMPKEVADAGHDAEGCPRCCGCRVCALYRETAGRQRHYKAKVVITCEVDATYDSVFGAERIACMLAGECAAQECKGVRDIEVYVRSVRDPEGQPLKVSARLRYNRLTTWDVANELHEGD